MLSVAFVTQKGGAGKTTMAASMAVAAAAAGEKVIALDLDPQASLASWGERRQGEGPSFEGLTVERFSPEKVKQLAAILPALQRKGFTVAVGGRAVTDSRCGQPRREWSKTCGS